MNVSSHLPNLPPSLSRKNVAIIASTRPVMTSNATTVPVTTVPPCDSRVSDTRSPAVSRNSRMSVREMSNGLSSTSQSSRSSIDSSSVGPRSENSSTIAGTSNAMMPAITSRNPPSVTTATRAGRSPRRRNTLATGSSARPSSTATAPVSTSTHSAVSNWRAAHPTMPMPIRRQA